MLKELRTNKKARAIYTLFCVVLAGFLQATIIQVFMQPMGLLSCYKAAETVELLREVGPHIIVNAFKTENFFGHFYLKPIE